MEGSAPSLCGKAERAVSLCVAVWPSVARALVPFAHQQVLVDLQVPVLVGQEGGPVQGGEAPAVTLVHSLGAVADDVVQLRWAGTKSAHVLVIA